MKRLIRCANQYIWESDWKLISLLKFCLLSLGICIGLYVPSQKKTDTDAKGQKASVSNIAAAAFIVSYIPLMAKFLRIVCADDGK